VLSARYHALLESAGAAERLDLFRGLIEDRFVSAYLDPMPYTRGEPLAIDRVADAIDVLRISSSSTYENRRINTGVLLFGHVPDPYHATPRLPDGALPYAQPLTMTRTFYRLCDGMRTVALVDSNGRMVELVDILEWAEPFGDLSLPAPSRRDSARIVVRRSWEDTCASCSRPTARSGICRRRQVFTFLDGRWRLSDVSEKYRQWEEALGHAALAQRILPRR
jgi:hypothetical protein